MCISLQVACSTRVLLFGERAESDLSWMTFKTVVINGSKVALTSLRSTSKHSASQIIVFA